MPDQCSAVKAVKVLNELVAQKTPRKDTPINIAPEKSAANTSREPRSPVIAHFRNSVLLAYAFITNRDVDVALPHCAENCRSFLSGRVCCPGFFIDKSEARKSRTVSKDRQKPSQSRRLASSRRLVPHHRLRPNCCRFGFSAPAWPASLTRKPDYSFRHQRRHLPVK